MNKKNSIIKKEAEKISKVIIIFVFFLMFTLTAQKSLAASVLNENEILLKIKDFSKTVPYSEYSNWILFSPSLSLNKTYRSEIENINYCAEKNLICQVFLSRRDYLHTKKSTAMSFNANNAKIYLEKISSEINTEPIDAKFKMENNKVLIFIPDQEGLKIDLEKSLEILAENFQKTNGFENKQEIILPYLNLKPKISSADVNDLGINTLIGEGKSNFKGSTTSRIHNIKTAMTRYDGLLLAPGEEFSFVQILGPVDGEHGYFPELVIKQDKTEPEFGGGICQVSTTVFRAAIYAGLEITARRNHAYPVSYYNPQGMDATIYVPKPDLKFKNNTPGHILFQPKIEGTELTFSLYGTNDGRKTEVDGPHVLEKKADGSMKTIFTQKVINENGEELINETFSSFYDSPDKFPHPSTEKITEKPKDWSKNQWADYKKANGI